MLDVVGVVSEECGDEGLQEVEAEGGETEVVEESVVNGERHEVRYKDAVVGGPEAAATATLEFLLDAAGTYETEVEALPDESPDSPVVAPKVLDPEVVVVGEEKHETAVVHFPVGGTVGDFVDAADAEAGRDTEGGTVLS